MKSMLLLRYNSCLWASLLWRYSCSTVCIVFYRFSSFNDITLSSTFPLNLSLLLIIFLVFKYFPQHILSPADIIGWISDNFVISFFCGFESTTSLHHLLHSALPKTLYMWFAVFILSFWLFFHLPQYIVTPNEHLILINLLLFYSLGFLGSFLRLLYSLLLFLLVLSIMTRLC